MSETPPAGWYPDPQDSNRQRYWDGTAWTEHTADAARSAETGQASASSSAGPDTWTWQSILVTILCCSPLGVAGALNAGRAEQALRSGDMAAAAEHASKARKWTLWGLAAWGLVIVLYIVFFLVILGSTGLDELQQF